MYHRRCVGMFRTWKVVCLRVRMWCWRSYLSVGAPSPEIGVSVGVEADVSELSKGGSIALWLVEFDDVSILNAKVAACECANMLSVLASITSLWHSLDVENFTSAIIFIFLSPFSCSSYLCHLRSVYFYLICFQDLLVTDMNTHKPGILIRS
jgi:hypothetical protein